MIAPPASGKTHACIERIMALKSNQPMANVWVIVPDRLQAAAFRRRLALAGGALGVQVGRFPDLNREILERKGLLPPLVSAPLQQRLIRETVDEAVAEGAIPYYAPLQFFPGFILSLRDAFAELKRAAITPAAFEQYTRNGTSAQKDMSYLYTLYQQRLHALAWADAEEITLLSIRELGKDPFALSLIQLLVVDGFDSFNQGQIQLLQVISKGARELLVTLPGEPQSMRAAHRRFSAHIEALIKGLSPKVTQIKDPPRLPHLLAHIERHIFESTPVTPLDTNEPLLLEARSPGEEAREALRWIKKLLLRENVPLAACAVFTPNPEVYHPLLRAAAAEFGIPIRFTIDEALESSPIIASMTSLISLPLRNYQSRILLNVLCSPYFDFSLDRETVDTLERISRVGQIVEGIDQWEAVWERLVNSSDQEHQNLDDERNAPRLPRGKEADRLRRELNSIFELIKPPDSQNSLNEWISWLEDLLERLRFQELMETERDRAANATLREVLRALVLSEQVAGSRQVDYKAFYSDFIAALTSESFREVNVYGKPALFAGRMTDARGSRFQAVALLGLAEGSFPVNERPDPFLDERLRADLGLELKLKREQIGLFYQAVTRSDDNLLITRPYLSEDGEKWEESAYWKAVQTLFTKSVLTRVNPDRPRQLTEAASESELLFSAVRRKGLPVKYEFLTERWHQLQHAHEVLKARRSVKPAGEHEGIVESVAALINQRYAHGEVWSASRLETYGTCPFQFFVRHALDLEPHTLPRLGLDARQIGSLLHEILEETYRTAVNRQEEGALIDSLFNVVKMVFAYAPEKYGFRPSALWQVEQVQLRQKLEETIRKLCEEPDWQPIAFEERFGLKGKPPLEIDIGDETFRVYGVIDRVDRNSAGDLRVIDYKTGSTHLDGKSLSKGYRLQLPIYALAARDALHLGNPVDGFYWKILAAEAGSLKLSKFSRQDEQGIEVAFEVLFEHLVRILQGVRAAEFPPKKPDGGCPEYCPAAQWCWRYVPSW